MTSRLLQWELRQQGELTAEGEAAEKGRPIAEGGQDQEVRATEQPVRAVHGLWFRE